MPSFSSDQLQKIYWLLSTCGQQAVQMANEPFQVFEKGKHDYVTSVDRLLDTQLSAGFARLFPEDGIITEENVQSRNAFRGDYQRLWFIDPIDGTDDFIHGRPHYAIMIGLLETGNPIAGWIYAPALDQLYYGGVDWGLFQGQGLMRSSRSSDRPPLPFIPKPPPPVSLNYCPMMIGEKDQRNFGRAIANVIPGVQFRSIGSFGLKVMQVVSGEAGIYIYLNGRVKLWDTTGPIALAQAAGLICCDLAGNALHFTPDAVEPDTLAHRQPILIGWPSYIAAFRPRLQRAVEQQQFSF